MSNKDDMILHLEKKLAAAQADVQQLSLGSQQLISTVRYIMGIVERGTGAAIPPNVSIEQSVLGYVKYLENEAAKGEELPVEKRAPAEEDWFYICDNCGHVSEAWEGKTACFVCGAALRRAE